MEISREKLAWAAGFFEGEGCFTMSRHGNNYLVPIASLSQVNDEPLKQFQCFTGIEGRLYHRHRSNGKWRPVLDLRVAGFEKVQAMATMLWPWFSRQRRSQYTAVATEYLQSLRRSKVCINGHVRTEENTGIDKQGRRICLICRRASYRAYDRRQRGAANGILGGGTGDK